MSYTFDDSTEATAKLLVGKYDGYLLEGMACPGGCVAGAGTIAPVDKSIAAIGRYSKAADKQNALDSEYEVDLPLLDE